MPDTSTHVLKTFMRNNLEDHRDECGEVNTTGLAELAADHFDLFEDRVDWRPLERCFDAACEVSWE